MLILKQSVYYIHIGQVLFCPLGDAQGGHRGGEIRFIFCDLLFSIKLLLIMAIKN